MTELIFHIGGGKTGSSSIQSTLASNSSILQSKGIHYWGIMLEDAPYKKHPWQKRGGTQLYYKTEEGTAQLADVITTSLLMAEKEGCKKAIWSNEWFLGAAYEFSRNISTVNLIKSLVDLGNKITVVAYIREHVSWSISAFAQWGLKHKTYEGPLMSFLEYTKKRPPYFAGPLQIWKDAIGNGMNVYNFHQCGNVVEHFLAEVCNLESENFKIKTMNKAPNNMEQFLRSVFNEIYSEGEQCLPSQFDRLFSHLVGQDPPDLISWYNGLMPDPNSLEEIYKLISDDVKAVNAILTDSNQPSLTVPKANQDYGLTPEDIYKIALMSTHIALQSIIKIESLERQVVVLRERIRHLKAGNS